MSATILFSQVKGGAGKTTLLTQLAAHWLAAGRRIALLDLDPQRSASAWAKARAASGRPALAALRESADWRAITDLREAKGLADLVLVDTAGRAEATGSAFAREVDLVLVPCSPSMADVWATEGTLATLRAARSPFRVVLNRVPARSRAAEAAEAALRATGAPLLRAGLGARSAFVEAFGAGAGASEIEPAGKAAEELRALAAEVAALLPGARR